MNINFFYFCNQFFPLARLIHRFLLLHKPSVGRVWAFPFKPIRIRLFDYATVDWSICKYRKGACNHMWRCKHWHYNRFVRLIPRIARNVLAFFCFPYRDTFKNLQIKIGGCSRNLVLTLTTKTRRQKVSGSLVMALWFGNLIFLSNIA